MTNEELVTSLLLASEAAALTHHVTWAELMGKAALAIEDLLSRCTECRETTGKAIDNINKAWHEKYEKDVPKWISVSEELPKESHDVLCFTDEYDMFIATYYGLDGDGEPIFDDDNGDYWEGNVIYWMPLPARPKEVGE